MYDLASLTKPLVTAFLAVYCSKKNNGAWKTRSARFFPAFSLPMTLGQLLTHSAGLPPWQPFYLYRPLADLAQIAALEDVGRAGNRVLYSDIGYILLSHMLEKISGRRIQGNGRRGDFSSRSDCAIPFSWFRSEKNMLRPHGDRQQI